MTFVSDAKIPKGPVSAGYLPVPADLLIEVRSPSDSRKDILQKVLEYWESGTPVVCVVDPTTETARVYRSDRDEEQFANGDTLRFEDVPPGFSVPLTQLFE